MFKIKYNHFENQVMFFRLFNTPNSFQSNIIKVMTKKLDVLIILYLDDILIYINEVDYINFVW